MKCRTWPPRLPIWFYQRVRNRGPWDYKQKNKLWADYGNFHYGAVGYAAGIPAEILHIAAGAAQEVAKTSLPVWGHFYTDAPFGDDPRDQFWIKQGIDYVMQHHY
ncbi:polymorphic toxin type 44 domain-containing protein [Enterobacter bugandensis]|uniref:polymorphic toxin type 44 domain-containing protein n=1 Tax=Enterobacter bugandensis TaxID=881260 RepID=UPI002FD63B4E